MFFIRPNGFRSSDTYVNPTNSTRCVLEIDVLSYPIQHVVFAVSTCCVEKVFILRERFFVSEATTSIEDDSGRS